LDIGTGTGLLTLMLAQKSHTLIDAIEMNKEAAEQAQENFQQSPWAERIHLYPIAIQQFVSLNKYDLIISNPPFFENDLRSPTIEKNDAKHDTSLTLYHLIQAIIQHLSKTGVAFVLIPYHRIVYLKGIAEKLGLSINEIWMVQQSPLHGCFRSIVLLSKLKRPYKEESIIIHDQQRQYSPEFTALLKDYYIKL
jgi:tRNA1Val (adenine37-N6)-methyltransferase